MRGLMRSYAVCRITLRHFGECFGSPEIFTTETGIIYGVMRYLMTTKASRGSGGVMTTKACTKTFPTPCTKTFTCIKSCDGSYARGGFTARSLGKAFVNFLDKNDLR